MDIQKINYNEINNDLINEIRKGILHNDSCSVNILKNNLYDINKNLTKVYWKEYPKYHIKDITELEGFLFEAINKGIINYDYKRNPSFGYYLLINMRSIIEYNYHYMNSLIHVPIKSKDESINKVSYQELEIENEEGKFQEKNLIDPNSFEIEFIKDFEEFLENKKPIIKTIFKLYFEGYSMTEIGKQINKSKENISKHISNTFLKFKEYYEKN